jgi:hypothetical protein
MHLTYVLVSNLQPIKIIKTNVCLIQAASLENSHTDTHKHTQTHTDTHTHRHTQSHTESIITLVKDLVKVVYV